MKNISEWKNKVEEYNSCLNKLLDKNSNHKDLYFRFEVFDGKLIKNPEILFIGINPGKGNGEFERNITFETEQISYLHIFDENYRGSYPNTYHLAEKTIKFFRLIGWEDEKIRAIFGKKIVKTNFYHLATKNIKDLEKVLNDVGRRKKYFKKSAEFSIQLINVLKPKVIILEGKSVFENIVKQCYFADKFKQYCEEKIWTDKNYGYYFDEENKSHIIGYSRGRNFSNQNRSDFITKLKDIMVRL